MNWVDAVVIGIVVISALLALMRGLVREVLGIGAWIGAAAVAVWGYPFVQPRFLAWLGNPDIADPAAFAALFLGALILLSVIAGMVGGVVRGSMLGGLDRTLGIVFGVLRGAALVAAAYIGLGLVVEPARWPPVLQQARSAPLVYQGAEWMVGLLPQNYRPRVAPPPARPETPAEDLLQPPSPARAAAHP